MDCGSFLRRQVRVLRITSTLTLVSAFAFLAVASYIAVYVVIVGLLVMALRSAGPAMTKTPGQMALIAAFLAITLAALLAGPLVAMNWLGPGVLFLILLGLGFPELARHAPRHSSTPSLAFLALVGTVMGFALGLYEIVFGVAERAGVWNNPIHYSGIMVLLGFASLAGFEAVRNGWRYLFLAGPILGIAGVLLSGSRGPFLACLALLALIGPLLAYSNRRDGRFWITTGALLLIPAAVLVISPLGPRAAGALLELAGGLGTGDIAMLDEGRTRMLSGAWQAFLDSPVWGHGWAGMMPAAEAYFPPDGEFRGFDHLHADIANFAVMAGVLGLLAYGLLIAAPLLTLIGMPRQVRREALIVAITTSVGYFVLGLTNALFGVLPQTMLYACLVGWLLHLRLSPPTPAAPN